MVLFTAFTRLSALLPSPSTDILPEISRTSTTSDIESLFQGKNKDDGRIETDKSVMYGKDDYSIFNIHAPNFFILCLFHSRKNLCIISPPHCFLQEKFLTVQYIQNAEKVLIIFLKWINNLQSITVR